MVQRFFQGILGLRCFSVMTLNFSQYLSGITRGRISLVRGHCNSCLGKTFSSSFPEGTTAILMTVEGHQGKFKNSKGACGKLAHLLSFDKNFTSS